MMRRAALLSLLFAGGALAETSWTPPAEIQKAPVSEEKPKETPSEKPKQRPVAVFGEDHPDCVEWTDGCIVCKRQETGDPACSMPGIACLPAEPACVSESPNR